MGNRSCYSNTRRQMQTARPARINLRNTSQNVPPMTQCHIYHDKSSAQNRHRYEIRSIDLQQKNLVDLFLVPYYNIEILTENLNIDQECSICFEPFRQQDIVARLECLCIYHKKCLDQWSQRKRCCPLHMDKIVNKYNSLNEFKDNKVQ